MAATRLCAYVGSITHETNAFSPVPTHLADYGHAIIGYEDLLSAARSADCDVVEGMSRRAAPSAPTGKADFESLRDALIADISAAPDLDMVLLSLHGAQVADGYPDCEGELVEAVRAAVGNETVVGVLLDLHASISERLLAHANLVTVIKEYPHTDFPVTAQQLVSLCMRLAEKRIRPVTAFVPVPLYTLWHTPDQPSRALVERARKLEAAQTVLHISLVHGFPWSDVADSGAAVLVITDDDADLATRTAAEFALALWRIREADLGHYLSINACLALAAQRHAAGPVVIADAADNPGAGCGGDSTWLLHALVDSGVSGAALGMLYDPHSMKRILAAGEGQVVSLELGGYSGLLAGPPLVGQFEVLCIRVNASIDAMPGYAPIEVGPLVAVRMGGVDIVVSAYREQVFGPRLFREVGLEPREKRVVVLKSAQHFYKAFEPIAARILYCDSPCSRSVNFASLPFASRRTPVWPIDPCTEDDIPAPRLF